MNNIKKELKEFRKFKETFEFKQKELIIDGDNIYCEGELVKEGENIPIGETEKWINVGYNQKGSYTKLLSNLFPYEFNFKGHKLNSIESFYQGIKFKNKKVQKYIFKYYGIQAVQIKEASNYDWKKTGIIYWQGKEINRFSKEYDNLIDELYISAIQNPLYRNVLLKVDKPIIHIIGEESKENTTFTRYEFEYMLNALSAFLKQKNIKSK